MRTIFSGATANASKKCFRAPSGLAWVLPRGILRYKNNGTGSCTLSLKDNLSETEVFTPISVSGVGGGVSDEFNIPYGYILAISATAGSLDLTVAIDGDQGDSGEDV